MHCPYTWIYTHVLYAFILALFLFYLIIISSMFLSVFFVFFFRSSFQFFAPGNKDASGMPYWVARWRCDTMRTQMPMERWVHPHFLVAAVAINMESPWTARQTLWGALQAKLLSCHVKTMHSLNNIIDGDYMTVLCQDMHAHGDPQASAGPEGLGLCMFNMSFRLPTQLWVPLYMDWLPAWLGWVAVYNPVACLLSVLTTAAASPKVLTASLCIQILGMRQCHTISLYIFLFSCHLLLLLFFELLFFLFCHCAGRTQSQHINFRTDIGQPFLQPVDAVWPPVRPVQQALHGRVHFLHALLWSARVPFLLAWVASAAVMWCRLIEIGAWTSWATTTVFVWLCGCVCVCLYVWYSYKFEYYE